jgi:hypothetical protein
VLIPISYAVFFDFSARNLAHRAFVAATILLRPAAEIVRFFGMAAPVDFRAPSFRTFAHRARCAAAIRALPALESELRGRAPLRGASEPFRPTKSSSTETADCNFSTWCCACLCSWRSCRSALPKLDIDPPHELRQLTIVDGRGD